jgi:xanthine dehydrogenase small subunit
MREYVLFYVNDRRFQISGAAVFGVLSDFIREQLQLSGTKVVCAEGDCGACTVLVGKPDGDSLRYETVDACICFLHQLDGRQVVTVEGLAVAPTALHPVQEELIDQHGSQCGFCTPGFVMALAGMCEEQTPPDDAAQRVALTGNLCRCTGYVPILAAATALQGATLTPLAQRYAAPAVLEELRRHAAVPVRIEHEARTYFAPRTLAAALEFKAQHADAVIVAGATELGVLRNKKALDPPKLLSLMHVPGLGDIRCADGAVHIGANVTWRQVERFAREGLPEFYKIVVRFGSPQIRNVATLVANVAHGSPIADALPLLCVMDAEVELLSSRGTRRVNMNNLYKGYKIKDLADDEIIAHVHLPLPGADELLKLYKVSRRSDLDIATFGAGIRVRRSGAAISQARIAYTGVATTVVRLRRTEAFLEGKPFAEETFEEAGRVARAEIEPISDVRGSRDFRLRLAGNILLKFYFECMEHVPVAV